ncbi:MAG: M14 family zinc carboxypeptidase [Phycisphaerales bacterium]|nr:M14 family zinc carboxypeptidase [Phycisphaerales bacterium]
MINQRIHRFVGLLAISAIIPASLAIASIPMPSPEDYSGRRVVEVDVPDGAILQLLLDEGMRSMACTPAPGKSPWLIDEDAESLLDSLGLPHRDMIGDLPAFIAQRNAQRLAMRATRGDDFYSDFRTLDEFNARLDEMLAAYPDLTTPIVIGQSHQGRDIRGIVIRAGEDNGRAACFLNGCQHAREWISPMTTMYMADTLLPAYGVDPKITGLLNKIEVIVVPVSNPDGYVYTYSPGGDRYWRKNRRDNIGTCDGVDLNRNWGSDWNGGQSTSNDTCSDIYVGPSSMSEPEVTALGDFMLDHGNIKTQVDFHAYSQLILEPRGYTTVPPSDFDELHGLGADMSAAIQGVNGKNYVHDNPCNILYCASGTLIDWPYDQYGSRSYCIELRPGSGEPGGFDPAPSEIRPCAEENYQAVLELMEFTATPLSIELPSGAPTTVRTNQTTTFPVTITARSETPVASEAVLRYRGSAGDFTEVPLDYLGGDNYEATLPTFGCTSVPEFFISVGGDGGGVATMPSSAPLELYSATPVSSEEIVFTDDCDSDPGWTTSGTATDGFWDRGVPVGGGVRGDAPTDASGTGACWQTDNVAGNSDVDNGNVILTSPVLDASEPGAILSYARWFSNSSGAGPGEDTFVTEVSDDGGVSWDLLEVVGPTGDQVNGGWYFVEFNLDDLVGFSPSSNFRVRFIVEDVLNGSVVEAAIDDIELSSSECLEDSPCPEDVAGNDGVVDVEDILALLSAFGTDDPDLDIDGSGFVDVGDILAVIAAWGEC